MCLSRSVEFGLHRLPARVLEAEHQIVGMDQLIAKSPACRLMSVEPHILAVMDEKAQFVSIRPIVARAGLTDPIVR